MTWPILIPLKQHIVCRLKPKGVHHEQFAIHNGYVPKRDVCGQNTVEQRPKSELQGTWRAQITAPTMSPSAENNARSAPNFQAKGVFCIDDFLSSTLSSAPSFSLRWWSVAGLK